MRMYKSRWGIVILVVAGLGLGTSYVGPTYLDELRLARGEASESIIEVRVRVIDGIDACEVGQSARNAEGETYDCGIDASFNC